MSSYDLSLPDRYRPDFIVDSIVDIDFTQFEGCNAAFDAHGTLYGWAWGRIPEEIANHIQCFQEDGSIQGTAIASNMLNPLVASSLGMFGPLLRAAELINAVPFPLYGSEQKPSPEGLTRMTDMLGWNAVDSIFIDDQLIGIRAAKDAGFGATILINKPLGWEPPWIQIKRRGPEARIREMLGIPHINIDSALASQPRFFITQQAKVTNNHKTKSKSMNFLLNSKLY